MSKAGLEIERKYLIHMPDEAQLAAMPGCEIWDIVQTYLMDGEDFSTRRVRSIRTGDSIQYIHTVKHRMTNLSHREWEEEVSREEYDALLRDANPALRAIHKRRYRIPYAGQLLEIDVYDFWQDRATLEIELTSEEEQVSIPDWLHIVRELTGERAYKNRFLAECVPMEEI
jgi:CYTH domain-containing protein